MIGNKENESSANNIDCEEDIKENDFAIKVREKQFLLMFDALGFKMFLVCLIHGNGVKLVIFYKFPLFIETCQYPGNFFLLDNSKRLKQINSFHVSFSQQKVHK